MPAIVRRASSACAIVMAFSTILHFFTRSGEHFSSTASIKRSLHKDIEGNETGTIDGGQEVTPVGRKIGWNHACIVKHDEWVAQCESDPQ